MKIVKVLGLLLFFALILVYPLLDTDAGNQSIAIYTLLFASAVTGWNILSGYSGYVSLGYSAFTGLGGYTLAIICDHWKIPSGYLPFFLVPVSGLVAAIFALPMGWIALRTRRVTFVVITIAMMFVLRTLASSLRQFTSGTSGLIFPITLFGGDDYNLPYYYVAVLLLLVAMGISWWIRNSKYGLGLLAIRDDEDHALGLGVRTWAFKLSAFVISAFVGGMVGAMFAYYGGSIFPDSAFTPVINLSVALMGFLGGVGTLAGPIIGAFILEPFHQYLSLQFEAGWDMIILGSLLLLIILFLPEGILPSLQKIWQKRQVARRAVSDTPSVAREKEAIVLLETGSGERGNA